MAKEDLIQAEFNQHPKKEFNGWMSDEQQKLYDEANKRTQETLVNIFNSVNDDIFAKKEVQEENTNTEE